MCQYKIRVKRQDEWDTELKAKNRESGERGSSQCGLLGRTESLLCDWSAASIPASDWLAIHVLWRLLGSLSTSLNATLQDLASSQCASLSRNNNKLQSPETLSITLGINLERASRKWMWMDQNCLKFYGVYLEIYYARISISLSCLKKQFKLRLTPVVPGARSTSTAFVFQILYFPYIISLQLQNNGGPSQEASRFAA